MNRILGLSIVLGVALCTLTGCTGGSSSSNSTQQQAANPTPAVTAVAPASINAGSTAQVITITGTGFVNASAAFFNGVGLQTTYSNATTLQATVPAASLTNGQTAALTVTTPSPGGGTSNSVSFAVNAPTPIVTTLSPSYVLQGVSSVLLVTGTGFEANSVVLLNGTAHAANFLNANSLQVPLAAADTQSAGSSQVTVNNPGPGGSTSPTSSFVIYLGPSIASLTPTTATAGSSSLQLTVAGSNFNANSVVQVDGAAQLTTFVSSTSLQATVSAAALASGRVANVSVHNPAPTIADSAVAALQVTTPLPVLSALNPSALASGQAATVTLSGSGFQASSSVLWNGSARTTTYVSSTSLKVALTAADLQPGTGQITVVNPAPGGGISTALSLTVVAPPTLSSLSPATVQASASYSSTTTTTVTLNGASFASNAFATVAGYKIVPTTQSATQMVLAVPSSSLYSTGAVNVLAYNPGPGTVSFASQPLVLNVINPAATFTINPTSAAVGSSALTLTLYGSGFFADSVVQWNGMALTTKYGSSSSLTATVPATLLSSLGTGVINVNTPENLGQTTPTQNFSTYVGLQVNDIVWNATDGLIYATVPGVVGQGLGNSLVGIDPNTGAVQKTIFVGSEPNRLAISSDGTQAFVGLDGAASLRQVNLTTGTAGVQVSLGGGSGVYNPPYTAISLAAVPGQPNSVALYASNNVVTIYDAGVARAKTGGTSSYFGSSSTGTLSFGAAASTLYLSNGALTSYTVDGTGITATKSLSSSNSATAVQYDKNRLYLNTGVIADSSSGTTLGQFSVPSSYSTTPVAASGPVASDSSLNKAFVLLNNTFSNSGVYVFDETTFNLLGSVPFSSSSSYSGTTGDLIRWGQNGLAYHLGTQLVILQSALVKDNSSTPVDLSLTAQAPGTVATGTSFATQFKVTNTGANTASGVTLNFGLPASLIPGQITASQGNCTGTGTIYCDLGTLASGANATVTLNGMPTTAGSLQVTAITNSQSFDSNTASNQATATTTVTGSTFNFAPVLTTLSPNLIASGSATSTLTVTGSGFTSGSVVNWNGSALPTTFVSSTSLTAQVDSSLVKTLGWALVTVTSAGPGGGTSGTLTESIYSLIALPANAMVYDPFARKLWTVLPSTSSSPAGNSLVPLDPATGTVGTAIPIGSEPNVVAETTSGNYLYIGLSGAKSLGRFNLATQKLDGNHPASLNWLLR